MNIFYVRNLCVAYLLMATPLFFGNWFNLKYALVFLIGHIFYFALYSRSNSCSIETVVSHKALISLAVLSLVWPLLISVGGVFLHTTDFIAYNNKFYELYQYKWPILIKERLSFSCYYYGYYLVPALLPKIFDLSVVALVAYTWLGIWLGLIWIYLLRFRNIVLVILLIMSGEVIFSFEIVSLALFQQSISYNQLLSLFIQALYFPSQVIALFQLSQLLRKNTLVNTYQSIPYKIFPNIYFQALLKHHYQIGANQYIGNPKSFYFMYLAPLGQK